MRGRWASPYLAARSRCSRIIESCIQAGLLLETSVASAYVMEVKIEKTRTALTAISADCLARRAGRADLMVRLARPPCWSEPIPVVSIMWSRWHWCSRLRSGVILSCGYKFFNIHIVQRLFMTEYSRHQRNPRKVFNGLHLHVRFQQILAVRDHPMVGHQYGVILRN